MLGRTAHSLFWMFRYLERAENTARLLEAGVRMALTRDLVTAEAEWRSVISTLGLQAAFEATNDSYDGLAVWNFVLRAPSNPASVRAMFGMVRANARTGRTNISSDVWEAVNDNWMKLDKLLARPVGQTAVGEVLGAVRRAAHRCTVLLMALSCATKAITSRARALSSNGPTAQRAFWT
jgi:uncharacterized alpha-E superfamily protein